MELDARGNHSNVLKVPGTHQDPIDLFHRNFLEVYYYNDIQAYIHSPFLDIQVFVDNAITKYIASISEDNGNVDDIDEMWRGNMFMPFYVPENDDFWANMNQAFLFFCALQFVYPFSQSVSQLIHEKSDKIKEGMQMMYVFTI